MNLNSIGLTIKELRKKSKLSQDDLANKLFVSRQAISNWECGKTYPDIDNIKKITEIFNVSLEEIIGGSNKDDNICEVLYGETLKEKKKNKKLVKVIIGLVVFLFLLVFSVTTYFFLDNYDSSRVYRVDSERGPIQDGLFVVTNDSWYLKLGSFISEKEIKHIRAYLKIDGKEELICDGLSEYYTLSEPVGYNELFRFSEKETINNFYLEITYEDDSVETKKLNFELEYENSKIFREKQEPISEDNNTPSKNIDSDANAGNLELRQRIKEKFTTENDKNYTYKFSYNKENYIAETLDAKYRLHIYNEKYGEKDKIRYAINMMKYTFIDVYDDNEIICSVKISITNPDDKGTCDKETEEKVKNVYSAFVDEMNS